MALYEASMKSPDEGFTSIAFEDDGLALRWKGPLNNDMLAAINKAREFGPVGDHSSSVLVSRDD